MFAVPKTSTDLPVPAENELGSIAQKIKQNLRDSEVKSFPSYQKEVHGAVKTALSLNQVLQAAPEKAQSVEVLDFVPENRNAMHLTQVQEAWQVFLQILKTTGKDKELAAFAGVELALENESIVLHIGNAVQKIMIERMHIELMQHLRKSLQNDYVRLSFVLDAQSTQKKEVLTTSALYAKLLEEQPFLATFCQELGLEFL